MWNSICNVVTRFIEKDLYIQYLMKNIVGLNKEKHQNKKQMSSITLTKVNHHQQNNRVIY